MIPINDLVGGNDPISQFTIINPGIFQSNPDCFAPGIFIYQPSWRSAAAVVRSNEFEERCDVISYKVDVTCCSSPPQKNLIKMGQGTTSVHHLALLSRSTGFEIVVVALVAKLMALSTGCYTPQFCRSYRSTSSDPLQHSHQ
uniref:Uncharacterized protein n=1 Tax=Proboscia inermis TaxID=420281 RepID=A0A7S0CEC5_9STRA